VTTFEQSFLEHWAGGVQAPYDPVKAHEYYMRTRKLKPGKKGVKTPDAVKKEYVKHLTTFLGALPMAKAGANVKDTVEFVKSMTKLSDKDMASQATKLARSANPADKAKADTITALLKNRTRVRAAKAASPFSKTKSTKQQAVAQTMAAAPSSALPPGFAQRTNRTR
jgi:hypothetical protein